VAVRPVGDTGWLLEPPATGDPVRDAATVLALAEQVRRGPARALAVDVVPAAATVLVTGSPAHHRELGGLLEHLVAAAVPETAAGPAGSVAGPVDVVLGVRFDGPDLTEVADLVGTSPVEVVRRVTGAVWTVAFTGFAPGFGYLVGGGLAVPRLDSPRRRVPPGSLGLAGPYAGMYPRASPGGWRLVGTLAEPSPTLFDPVRRPPALLPPGARVRFAAAP
jgi:KipI family sensor histidine kinase inhibitor